MTSYYTPVQTVTAVRLPFKGLLSIPSDGRGARRPLGQSFRKFVGPAALYWVSALIAVTIYSFGWHMSTL